MYVRFIVLAQRRRRPFGVFRADRSALDDAELPEWLREQVAAHYDWFNKNLRIPRNRKGGRIEVTGVCWFRAEAREHIARARHLAWLLAEAGHPTQRSQPAIPAISSTATTSKSSRSPSRAHALLDRRWHRPHGCSPSMEHPCIAHFC